MTLRLVRSSKNRPHGQENWEVYDVMSGSVRIGHVSRGNDNGGDQCWGWAIQIYIHQDGQGLPHGGPYGSREDAMAAIARRWRLWLQAAALSEIDIPPAEAGDGG